MKHLLPAAIFPLLLSATAGQAMAAPTVVSFTPNRVIPDDSNVGAADMQVITSDIVSIETIQITVTLTGGFNGDYFMYLEHDGGYSVLLNRPGLTTTDDLGYMDSGMSVTFTASAANGDIHHYGQVTDPGGGPLTGFWQPDGRAVNPLVAYDTEPRTALLDSFEGKSASGLWTLFVADRSGGSIGTLTSWGMTITGVAVPETSSAVLALAGLLPLCLRRRRRC